MRKLKAICDKYDLDFNVQYMNTDFNIYIQRRDFNNTDLLSVGGYDNLNEVIEIVIEKIKDRHKD